MVQSVCHFCYPFATTNVFCYQLSFIIVNCILAATTQNIKQKLKILSFVKTVKNALLIRMSLVRVQLPEPRIPRGLVKPRFLFNMRLLPICYQKQPFLLRKTTKHQTLFVPGFLRSFKKFVFSHVFYILFCS